MTPEDTPPASDALFGNHASDLMRAAMGEVRTPATDPSRWVPPMPEVLQAVLPQYEVVAFLGRGGMGAVYQGRQLSLEREVAIKILPPGLDELDASYAGRFRNEARAMAKLQHLGIVAVYDFGETVDGMLYIAMEYIEGTDVAQMVAEQGRLPSEHAMAITAHVCDALSYAHERGIIHRDIKPSNIMVGRDGTVKVADFGLAKMMAGAGHSGLTRSGMAMGTLHYIAPEALTLGIEVDQRADIYAVGVMFYQMLTGHVPQGLFELPSLQVPGLDPRYDRIIACALRNDREKRYGSARELRRDLDEILTRPVAQVVGASAGAAVGTQLRQAAGATMDHARRVAPVRGAMAWGFWGPVIGTGVVLLAFVLWAVRQPDRRVAEDLLGDDAVAEQVGAARAPVRAAAEPNAPAEVRMGLLARGGMHKMGGYRPQLAATSTKQPASIVKAPAGIADAEYGEIKLGPADSQRTFAFIIDSPNGNAPRLFVDGNANGDLTDDPPAVWKLKSFKRQDGSEEKSAHGGFDVQLRFGEVTLPVHLEAYRFDPKEPKRPHDALLYYSDYVRTGTVNIGGKVVQALLTDDDCKGDFSAPTSSLRLDLNGDGRYAYQNEQFHVKDAFNIGGTTYEIAGLKADGSSFSIVKSARRVEERKPPVVIKVGDSAPSFTAETLAGGKISMPGSFKGKIVLLDFWAMWCPPCIGEIPHVVAAYEKHHAAGLEILGVSLDGADFKKTLPPFLSEKKMSWQQTCDGLGWKTAVAKLYGIDSIPAALLIDGDTGKVLARNIRGEGLAAAISKALAEKRR